MEEDSYCCSFYMIPNLLLKGARTSSIRMWEQPRAGKHKVNVGTSTGSEELTKVNDPTAFRKQRGLDEEGTILGHLLQES